MKGEYQDEKLLDTIVYMVINQNKIELSLRELGNLIASFGRIEISCSTKFLNIVCDNFP